jgi:hypothetical protein
MFASGRSSSNRPSSCRRQDIGLHAFAEPKYPAQIGQCANGHAGSRNLLSITVECCVEPPPADGFLNAMGELERRRRRDGVIQWALFHDVAQPSRYVETFIVESWAEELRRHEHVTVEDRAAEDRVLDFLAGRTPPIVTHFVAEHLMHESRHNHAAKATGPF